MNGNHQTTEKKNPRWSTKKSNPRLSHRRDRNIITYLQGASCRQDKWEILIMEGRIYDSRMNGNRTDLVLNGVDFKKYKRRIANHHAKLILSNTCISDYAENMIFGKGFNGSDTG
jgi:hypothetical protein